MIHRLRFYQQRAMCRDETCYTDLQLYQLKAVCQVETWYTRLSFNIHFIFATVVSTKVSLLRWNMIQLRAVTIYRYVSIRTWPIPYRYAWVPYHDTFRYLLVKNLVISNLKIYIQAGLQIFFSRIVGRCDPWSKKWWVIFWNDRPKHIKLTTIDI